MIVSGINIFMLGCKIKLTLPAVSSGKFGRAWVSGPVEILSVVVEHCTLIVSKVSA